MKKIILENKEEAKNKTKDVVVFNFLSIILIISGLGLIIFFFYNYINFVKNNSQGLENIEEIFVEEIDCKYRRSLDGECVNFQKDISKELVFIMVENHTDARPQSSLSKARIVYEAPVEANYTRFMAVFFKDDEVEKVGPVRSARPYFLDWLSEYGNPLYIHVGGSPVALERITSENIFDMNEFYRGSYFWRSDDRYAPHNAYTSSNLWQANWNKNYNENYKTATSSWNFGKTYLCQENCIENIYIAFLKPSYVVEWKYNSSTEKYLRYQVNQKHLDQDGSEILADNIILQYVNTRVIDQIGRLDMDTITSGKVEIFQKGNKISGIWKKENLNTKTRFFDENNVEIVLNSGKIWIEVVNQNCEVKDY